MLVTNPIWVVKTRMCLRFRPVEAAGSSSRAAGSATPEYRGLWDGLRTIFRREGIRGAYKVRQQHVCVCAPGVRTDTRLSGSAARPLWSVARRTPVYGV